MKKQIFSIFIYSFLALFAATIKADENAHDYSGICIKCGTPQIVESILLGTAKIAGRPLEMHAWVSSTHFRVHYDTTGFHAPDMTDEDGNGIPDYVDSTLVYLKYAWDIEVNQLGYPEPLTDDGKGGGDEIDVYLKNLNNVYGQTWPETYMGSTSSYIEIDNDFSEAIYATHGYDALRVTTAHEFFHTIHFSHYYDVSMSLTWWMEHTAVWMEDRVWDDVNDYLAYLQYFFDSKETPLTTSNGQFEYGAAIWAHYLAKKFGDDIIKDLWEHMSELKTFDIAVFDDIIPIGLPGALGEFAVWNYFTEDRANTIDFYPDSNLFEHSINTDISANKSPTYDSLSTEHLTSRYVELLFVEEWGENDALRVYVTPLDGGSYVNSLIFFNGPNDYRIHTVDPSGEDIPLERTWEKAILVTSCTNTRDFTYNYTFEIEILEDYNEQPHYAFSVKGTYPNPFNSSTTISFTFPERGNVSIRVFNALGQKVENIFDGRLEAGKKEILWKPSNLSGGVYMIKLTSPWGSKTLKTLYLK